jgi:hypothetical protein
VDPERARVLAGLPGVYVELSVPPETREEGIRLGTLATDILLRLRELGIEQLTLSQIAELPGRPRLVVRVDAAQDSYGNLSPMVELQLVEAVAVERLPGLTLLAPTWRTGGLGVGLDPQEVRPFVMSFLEEFAAEFQAANPR